LSALTALLEQFLTWLTTVVDYVLDTPLLLVPFMATIVYIVFRILFSVFRANA
jgi:hypothetical protein